MAGMSPFGFIVHECASQRPECARTGSWRSFAAVLALACSPAPQPTSAAAAAVTETRTQRYCAGTVTEFDVHRCIFELTSAQQRRRGYAQRLVFRRR